MASAKLFSAKKVSRLRKLVVFGVLAIFAASSMFVGIRMATMEADVSLSSIFSMPEGVSLEAVGAEAGDRWAAAVDGKFVVGRDAEKVQATASTTKMILALSVLEKKPLGKSEKSEKFEITQEMYDIYTWYVQNNGSNTKVEVGEKISEYDALVSVMLKSSNNMADSLAIWAFGSISEYQKYATEMIKRLGLTKTTIGVKDASGYNESTTSTAKDLAEIGYRVMTHPVLSEIIALKSADVPVAGKITNTNLLLGKAGISGVKTGYIGEPSGYCIVSGYNKDGHVVTVAFLNAKTRDASFEGNLAIVKDLQKKLVKQKILKKGDEVGYYDSWWTGKISVRAAEDFSEVNYKGVEAKAEIHDNELNVIIGEKEYHLKTDAAEFAREPSLFERFLHVFGWKK